jgi:hypothetical protein
VTIAKRKALSDLDLTFALRLITLSPLSEEFQGQFLTKRLLRRILSTATDIATIAELLRHFTDREATMEALVSFAEGDSGDFTKLLRHFTQ